MSPWKTEEHGGEGLPHHFDILITESRFTKNARFKQGDGPLPLVVEWRGRYDLVDDDSVIPSGENDAVYFTTGKNWDSHDGGKTAVHTKQEAFDFRTAYGRLIDICTVGVTDQDGNAIKLEVPGLQEKGDPRQADIWVGYRFRMERRRFPAPWAKDKGYIDALVPVEYLGTEGDQVAAPATATSTAGTANVSVSTSSNGSGLMDRLKELARNSANHSEFYVEAVKLPGVATDAQALEVITDVGRFEELKSGG